MWQVLVQPEVFNVPLEHGRAYKCFEGAREWVGRVAVEMDFEQVFVGCRVAEHVSEDGAVADNLCVVDGRAVFEEVGGWGRAGGRRVDGVLSSVVDRRIVADYVSLDWVYLRGTLRGWRSAAVGTNAGKEWRGLGGLRGYWC